MARIHFIAFVVVLYLFASCGQVGSITGGEEDHTSPRVIEDQVKPPIGSTNISPNKIIIPFDEYIKFNQPGKNIRVTPDDVKLDYSIKGKSVELSVKSGEWQPNTTYTIYLNRAVKDITEGNDSIIGYVFSTGDYLDSLQTTIQINDAYTGKPLKDITVGLYTSQLEDDTSKVNPRYYASTNEKGIASFKNIKDASFYAYAFEDENRNNRLDIIEKRAALKGKVNLSDTTITNIPIIRLMPPIDTVLKVISNEVLPTASWCLGFNRTLKENEHFDFLYPPPNDIIWNKEKDSLTAFYESTKNSGDLSGVLHTASSIDTISKKYFLKDQPLLKITTNLVDKQLGIIDTLKIIANEPIKSIDTALIQLLEIPSGDSIKRIIDYTLDSISPLETGILFKNNSPKKLYLNIAPGGVKGLNYSLKDSLNVDFTLQGEKETGIMIIKFDSIPPYGILFITNSKSKKQYKVIFDGVSDTLSRIEYLAPGKYEFHYLIDKDKDGKWTTGSIFSNELAEEVIWFPTISTIRANWEVKTTLPIKKEEIVEEVLKK